ncbi:putative Alpha-1A adrenergic receptor [Hypsibius exemplaris]|uniref:Alpha-1A adrenergic receptor n=1 Tax=Hypsibius exemplaris TaxID=2072580 RepID=A0A1W0WR64_HYPEX|nr:putative Alpha-1A adrenergic receptor [Hypsibius exemplaris]
MFNDSLLDDANFTDLSNVSTEQTNASSSTEGANNNDTVNWAWDTDSVIPYLLIIDALLTIGWSVLANSIILIAVLIDRNLQHNAYFYGVSLALADLIGTVDLGFGCYFLLFDSWPIESPGLCKFWNSVDYTTGLIASLSIGAISFDRYKMVKYPEKYLREETTKRVIVRIVLIWLFSILFYVPTTTLWDVIAGYTVIASDDCDPEFRNVVGMTVSQFLAEFLLPFVVIVYCNLKLLLFVRGLSERDQGLKYNLSIVEVEQRFTKAPGSLELLEEIAAMQSEVECVKQDIRTIDEGRDNTFTLIILVGTFFSFWCPWEMIGNFARPICHCIPDYLYNAAFWLQYHLVAVNAIVYGLTIRRFRHHFNKVFRIFLPFRFPQSTDKSKRLVGIRSSNAVASMDIRLEQKSPACQQNGDVPDQPHRRPAATALRTTEN